MAMPGTTCFSHDQARSRAYHWGEDGLAGLSDERQVLCFALAVERAGPYPQRAAVRFDQQRGQPRRGREGVLLLPRQHPHPFLHEKYLYKYPQREFPYDQLVETNRRRSRAEMEYELFDTGIFDDDRYFDVFVEYAKVDPEDILIQISAANRGPDPATLHLLPTLWFRNTWSWPGGGSKPVLSLPNGPVLRAGLAG